jgi:hypothetical protein
MVVSLPLEWSPVMRNDTILNTALKSFVVNGPGLNRYSQIKI